MPLSKLVFKPGVNRDQTNYSNEGSWVDCDKIRFRSGFPEKMGGWVVTNQSPFAGVARELHAWNTSDGGTVLCVGTSKKIYVVTGTNVYDITPIRTTFTSPATNNIFTTSAGSNIVVVTLPSSGVFDGDYVTFSGSTAVGGIPADSLNKEFQATNLVGDTFQITVDTAATSSATGGGTSITAAFQIHIGNDNTAQGYGWGAGGWGRGGWGSASTVPINLPARVVFAQTLYDDLYFVIKGVDATSPQNFFYWSYAGGTGNRAVLLSSVAGAIAVPQRVDNILFASSGHMLALGCTTYNALGSAPDYLGDYDPLTIRWANVDADIGPQPEVWQPTTTNNSGFVRIESGSRIVSAVNTRQETLVWTERSLTSLQFLGTEEVFGKQELASAITIAGPNVTIASNNVVYWMGTDKFYQYSGRADTLPCTLRTYVFDDINREQGAIFLCGSNAKYSEIIWFYCSAASREIDRYVVYNYSDNIWYYGQLSRTAWIDAGIMSNPTAVANGWVYAHESGHDDGQPLGAAPLPLNAYIQSADLDIDDGDKFMLIRRVLPDVGFEGSDTTSFSGQPQNPSAYVTIGTRNFPGAVSADTNAVGRTNSKQVVSTAMVDQYTNQVFIRARGRQINFKISSDSLGTKWQLGMPRIDARPDGMRG